MHQITELLSDSLVPILALVSGIAGLLILRSSLRRKPDHRSPGPIEQNAHRVTNFSRVTKIY